MMPYYELSERVARLEERVGHIATGLEHLADAQADRHASMEAQLREVREDMHGLRSDLRALVERHRTERRVLAWAAATAGTVIGVLLTYGERITHALAVILGVKR